jgi:UDPglucose 6-dehydrogenase
MRVTVFGTGYVGLVTGTCLAEVGHQVVCVDIDADKIDGLNRGVIPIYEPGLEAMVLANHGARRISFTTDAASAITHGEVIFIAVGTPPDEDGSADLQYVLTVARTIGRNLGKRAASSSAIVARTLSAVPTSRSTWCPTPNSSRRVMRSRTACAPTAS